VFGGEILLDTNSFCNLVTLNCLAFVNKDSKLDKNAMFEAQRLNARMSYRVTLPELELPKWNVMQKKYRLTGLSLTGYQDMVNATNMSVDEQRELLRELKKIAVESADKYADQLGLNRSELVTTVKPEGTLSLLPTVSSGLHMNHSEYYIRRIRINSQDPLCKTCEELGYPTFPEVGQNKENPKTKVIEFPVKSPHGKTKYDVSAIEQLEIYKMFMEEYVQHNASNTISVRNDKEWNEVVDWVYENWDTVIGITFISLDDSFYQLLPYESCTEEEYNRRKKELKPITYSALAKHETFELFDDIIDESCSSGVCGVR
jgi:ribonucleoside-diphosphate reductase alpha chain/ribonucleoside-triphosphate reductase